MRSSTVVSFAVSVCMLFTISPFVSAQAREVPADASPSSFARTGGAVKAPVGWTSFCAAQPEECRAGDGRALQVRMDAAAWRQLRQVDRLANHQIEGVADDEHYGIYKMGIINWWTYPDDGKGNCNDYVLLKRKLLVEAGWPKSALLLTVVLDHENKGHLVLTVRTDAGDLILDNMVDDILAWDETGYTFVKRQSAEDPNVWLEMEPGHAVAGVASLPASRD
ncbi:transglutaminase-like cysteine peptidase [Labrys wisconsinensis]|uniref:Transglutaminase-like cysteine proteinase n=1 Tax=Labrys wisconsinensis TaxID=425677 RepID=A0ABU0J3K2_9HYPH|nr:transglutaminase-like cysteine peptidase [Labrys wisconsinensis]MDQ0468843.1 putative transglutaminase-like cysteine proteinase [Labrys wisconsinensis]